MLAMIKSSSKWREKELLDMKIYSGKRKSPGKLDKAPCWFVT
jgi:hypothetical protein